MIETVHGTEPHDGDIVGGSVQVQYDRHGGDIGLGITLNRAALEHYLHENPELATGTPAYPDNGLVFFVRLERPGTNRLVRLLRKARDVTFGADE
jgi:hypothetical protein